MQLNRQIRSKPSLIGGVAFSLTLLLIASSFFNIYYLSSSGDGDLLWNVKAAYLFVHGERRGYHVSYLGYLAELVKGFFGVLDSPDERNSFTLVIQITPAGIESHEVNGIFEYYTPADDTIYGACDGDLWKWTSTRFEKAALGERKKFDGIERLSKKDFTNVNGWSGRRSITSKIKEQFPVVLGGIPMTVEVTTLNLRAGEVSVDLLRHDLPAETLFRRSGQPRRVSRSAYQQNFNDVD
jgi:hypothetical protein